jgi:hypothetical protein
MSVLPATDEEIAEVTDYVESQAPDLKVTFCQKIYSESVLSHRHDVWDVHTTKDRWWVITIEHICSAALAGETNKHRRQLFKTQADAAWTFVNWLTHTTTSNWHDAEAAVSAAETVISLCTNAATLHIRNVPNGARNAEIIVSRLSERRTRMPRTRFGSARSARLANGWESPCVLQTSRCRSFPEPNGPTKVSA